MRTRELERAMKDYHTLQSLQSWADLFGFNVRVGSTEQGKFAEVDGYRIEAPTARAVLQSMAERMGADSLK